MKNRERVVIVGGGFAGINLAKKLAKNTVFEVVLIDRNHYNFFPPLLYQVATGFLDVSSISFPYRKLVRDITNIRFRLGELMGIVPSENKIELSDGEMYYDHLILATGTEANFFGMENIKKYALPIKSITDAIAMRNHLFQKLEDAVNTTDLAERTRLTTFVIAGGGPTGVEIAGILSEMAKTVLQKDYPELEKDAVKIYLINSSEALLQAMSSKSQAYALLKLRGLGVKVLLHKRIENYNNEVVSFSDGSSIETKTLIWSAGVLPKTVAGIPKESYGKGNRLIVNEFNKVCGTPNIFAIGDIALQNSDKNFPIGHPQVAQVAMQQGRHLAKNLIATIKNKPLTPFKYYDKGSMAIIGANKAVVDLPKPKIYFKGFIAWIAWLILHLSYLANYRNKVKTLYNWLIAYLTKDNSLRMIIRPRVEKVVDSEVKTIIDIELFPVNRRSN
jgi:NADH dehydrogenase